MFTYVCSSDPSIITWARHLVWRKLIIASKQLSSNESNIMSIPVGLFEDTQNDSSSSFIEDLGKGECTGRKQ